MIKGPLWSKTGNEHQDRDWFFDFTAKADRELDQYLVPYDILNNLAQARALHKSGLISEVERDQLLARLRELWETWSHSTPVITDEDEDVHSAIERILTTDLGDIGKRIHTGRSRNDQVLCDMRMYLRSTLTDIGISVSHIITRLQSIAEAKADVFFPGYTHTQPAMPNSVDAWCLGYVDLLLSDLESLQAAIEVQRWCPLGSAAGYGVPELPIDREYLASILGFEGPQIAVTAAQLSRGALELRAVDSLAYLALTLNRLASDIIMFSNPDLGWVHLSEDQTSGSSIMPQKRNPDVWELIRAHAHQFVGLSTQLFSLSSNLSSGYHRDLQLVKSIVVQAVESMQSLLDVANKALAGVHFDADKARQRLSSALFATHLANRMVAEGMPFRDAYKAAAEQYASLKIPSQEEISASYKHTGSIAERVSGKYEERVKSIKQWFEESRKEWDAIAEQLKR